MFLIALLYFGDCYFLIFGTVATAAGAVRPAVIDIALFTAFALHHSILARSGAKAVVTRIIPPVLERSVYVWVASLMFMAVCALWQPVPGVLWQTTGALAWALRAVTAFGVVFTLRSALMLDVFELAGTRAFMAPHPMGELKSHGPYGFVRHPIYLAWLFLVWAPPTMTGTRLVFAAISTAYLVIAIPIEERSLRATIGPAYAAYAAQVRWRIIPGIY